MSSLSLSLSLCSRNDFPTTKKKKEKEKGETTEETFLLSRGASLFALPAKTTFGDRSTVCDDVAPKKSKFVKRKEKSPSKGDFWSVVFEPKENEGLYDTLNTREHFLYLIFSLYFPKMIVA